MAKRRKGGAARAVDVPVPVEAAPRAPVAEATMAPPVEGPRAVPLNTDPSKAQIGIPRRGPDGSWTFLDPTQFTLGNAKDVPEAQTQLERSRAKLEIAPPTREDAQRSAAWHATQRAKRTESLDQILARRPQLEPPAANEDAERILIARVEAQIPDSFTVCPGGCPWTNDSTCCPTCGKPYVPLRWDMLASLINEDDEPSLRGVRTTSGKVLFGEAAVAELQGRMMGPGAADRIVLFGETGVGKSVTAAAFLNATIVAGAERPRWTSPFVLRDTSIDRALGARTLVLDDLGEEFAGADSDTGLAAQRALPVCDLMGALARTRGKRLIVTTYLTYERTVKLYGGGVARRVYTGADVIQFVRHDE
jgi:hypothetical protein